MNPIVRVLLIVGAALAAEEESKVEQAATNAVQKLTSMGADSVEKRAVIGGIAGLIGGIVVKKAQDTVLTCGLVGGVIVGGACYVRASAHAIFFPPPRHTKQPRLLERHPSRLTRTLCVRYRVSALTGGLDQAGAAERRGQQGARPGAGLVRHGLWRLRHAVFHS